MAAVIEVFNADGTKQSVSLRASVRAEEVVAAIARRHGLENESARFALYLVVVWREVTAAPGGAFDLSSAEVRVELEQLGPDDCPLEVRAECETRIAQATVAKAASNIAVSATHNFAFLDETGAEIFHEQGDEILVQGSQPREARQALSGSEDSARRAANGPPGSHGNGTGMANGRPSTGGAARLPPSSYVANQARTRTNLRPIVAVERGDLAGSLLQRSVANPREWQRRWCVLRENELVHCFSNTDHHDATYVRLSHNRVRALPPEKVGGLKYCFEVDTPHDAIQFHAKSTDEANEWIRAIERNIALSSENEKLLLAERMIEDGQRSLCTRDEAVVQTALGSLEGLLSTHAGADRLYRFAKRTGLGDTGRRNASLVGFFVDLERASASLSAMPAAGEHGLAAVDSSSVAQADLALAAKRSSFRYLQSGASVASSGSSATGSTLRFSAAALSRKEWMLQICDRISVLFDAQSSHAEVDELSDSVVGLEIDHPGEDDGDDTDARTDNGSDTGLVERPGSGSGNPQLDALVRASEQLRRELANESLRFIPRESCLGLLEEARRAVVSALEADLYAKFRSSPEYERVVAGIPSRLRRNRDG